MSVLYVGCSPMKKKAACSTTRMLRLVCAAGCAAVLGTYGRHLRMHADDPVQERKALAGCIRACGTLLFPCMLEGLLPERDHACTAMLVPVAWITLIHLVDSHLLFSAPSSDESRLASIRMEPGPLAGLTFGLSGFMGTKCNGPYGHLFLYAVVGCLAAVLPSHNLRPGCIEEQVLDSVQKSLLFWCVGLLIAGVSLTKNRVSA